MSDVHADVQGRDLYGAAADIDQVLKTYRPDASQALTVTLSGQVQTMRESYNGLFTGIALAIILVYLFLVMNFQSWIDPLPQPSPLGPGNGSTHRLGRLS